TVAVTLSVAVDVAASAVGAVTSSRPIVAFTIINLCLRRIRLVRIFVTTNMVRPYQNIAKT
ncbi:MAG: hypothetical protein M3N26_11605, partial [Pseudomonadota bacterium]|nr:hypothetical protein [Pseudomonadota bacterium]